MQPGTLSYKGWLKIQKTILLVTVFLVVTVAYYYLFAGPDLTTPRSAFRTGQRLVEEANWSELYALLHPEFKDFLDGRLRILFRLAAKHTAAGDKNLAARLSDKPAVRFEALLESLNETARTQKMIKKYQTADVNTVSVHGDTAQLTLTHDQPLAFDKMNYKKSGSRWLINNIPELFPDQSR